MPLNKSQDEAFGEIRKWLLSDEKCGALSGGSGYGKTYLTNEVVDDMASRNQRMHLLGGDAIETVISAATTNKAASLLDDGVTAASALKLRLQTDFDTGEKTLVPTQKTEVHENTLFVVDEASQCSPLLMHYLNEYTAESSKILYVGDHAQLLPVKSATSPVYDAKMPQFRLTIPERQNADSYLFQVCQQLRQSVETGKFQPIEAGPKVNIYKGKEGQDLLEEWFKEDSPVNESKIITYENSTSIRYNAHIRKNLGFSADWEEGDQVSVRNRCYNQSKRETTIMEREYTIDSIGADDDYLGLEFRWIEMEGERFRLAKDHHEITEAIKYLAKQKKWREMYFLSENFLDLRSAYACTGHTSQGGSFDRAFLNLAELGKCKNPDTFARLMYVALSRAKYEVALVGELPAKYRGG